MFAHGKIIRRRLYLKTSIIQSNAKTVQRHEERLPFAGVELTAGLLQVFDDVSIIRKEIAAILPLGIDLQTVVVPAKVRCRYFDPAAYLPKGGFIS